MIDEYKVVMITDPELLLPTDSFPSKRLICHGELIRGEFQTIGEIMLRRGVVEMELNKELTDWQKAWVRPGQFVLRTIKLPGGELNIYGFIPTLEQMESQEQTPIEGRHIVARLADAWNRGWMHGMWYSTMEPAGEWGTAHKSQMTRELTPAQWDAAKVRGWQ